MNSLLSGSVLAASMLLGQTPEPPTLPSVGTGKVGPSIIQQTQAQTAPQPSAQRPVANWFSREDRPIITKIQGWFKRDPQPAPNVPQPPVVQPTTNSKVRDVPTPTMPPQAPTDFPRKLPNPSTKTKAASPTVAQESMPIPPKALKQAALQQSPTSANAKSPILPQWSEKIGRDEKFEWVTGQIELENGTYVIYYATPETVDQFHGRLVLVPQQIDMKSFRRGDLVSLRGQVGQRQTLQGATAIYRLTDASLIERPKQ